jgi:hypothetical protein
LTGQPTPETTGELGRFHQTGAERSIVHRHKRENIEVLGGSSVAGRSTEHDCGKDQWLSALQYEPSAVSV